MNGGLRVTLQVLCEDVTAGEYVFRGVRTGSRGADIKKGFASACLAAGVHDFVFHTGKCRALGR